jgi:hypothetical protein
MTSVRKQASLTRTHCQTQTVLYYCYYYFYGVRSPAETEDFSSFPVSRPALGPTQPPVEWVLVVLSPGVKRSRNVTLTTYSISVEVENE